jgi:tripartite-type tricarboxylate transporter receptor subunit TctC
MSTTVWANYPERVIRFVVPWPAGGSSDSAARVIAAQLEARLGKPVVVENKPGASGNIGTAEVARAEPDGYTLLLSSGPFTINPSLFRTLPFDAVRDFAPITQIAATPSILVVNPSFPAKTIQEFVSLAKDKTKPFNYASPGNGTAQHLAMELLKKKADLSLAHVPYRGGAPALNDLLGGHVLVMLSGLPEVMPHIKAGALRPLAVTTGTRLAALPDVPTLMEVALAEFETGGWNGLHVRAGTPAEIVSVLGKEVRAALQMPEVREKLMALGFEVRGSATDDFAKFVTSQIDRFREAVEIAGLEKTD